MGNLSEVYKYPMTPTVQRVVQRVDTLEDRLARQDAALNPPMVPDVCECNNLSISVQVKESSMPEGSEEVVISVAEDFRKSIGMIVNESYQDMYVEVVGIVENLVAVKYCPNRPPTLVNPTVLRGF